MSASSHAMINETLERLTVEAADHFLQMGVSTEAVERIKECFLFNTQSGKMFRSRTVVQTGLMLSNHDCTPRQVEDLQILGSLIDFENAAYCVWDDIMDNSTTRRGLLCWYRRDRVGLIAVNDGCLLKSMISLMVTKHFKSHPIYVPLIELLNDASLRTELGQNIDLMAAEKLVSLEQFTDDRYQWIIEHKTAYYTFYVPFAIPFIYLGLATPKTLEGIYQIGMFFGLIFQARDDFLDVYGDAKTTGKIGTDIMENKCTWLAVEAMKRSDERQRSVLKSCYGSQNEEDIKRVKEIFDELELEVVFEEWNARKLKELSATVERVCAETGIPKDIFADSLSRFLADPRRDLPQPRL